MAPLSRASILIEIYGSWQDLSKSKCLGRMLWKQHQGSRALPERRRDKNNPKVESKLIQVSEGESSDKEEPIHVRSNQKQGQA